MQDNVLQPAVGNNVPESIWIIRPAGNVRREVFGKAKPLCSPPSHADGGNGRGLPSLSYLKHLASERSRRVCQVHALA